MVIAPGIGARFDRGELVPALIVGINPALAAKVRIDRRVMLVRRVLIAAGALACQISTMVRATGRPSSSVMRPCTMMRSPSAVFPSTVDRSGIGGKCAVLKRGPVVSVIVCGRLTSLSCGCRFWVLP